MGLKYRKLKVKNPTTSEYYDLDAIKGDKGDKGDPGATYDDTEIRSEITEIKKDLVELNDLNFKALEFTGRKYLDVNGNPQVAIEYGCTELLDIAFISDNVSVYAIANVTSLCAYYNENEELIGSLACTVNKVNTNFDFRTPAPEGTKYVSFCSKITNMDVTPYSPYAYVSTFDSIKNDINYLKSTTEEHTEEIDSIKKGSLKESYISVFHDNFSTVRSDWVNLVYTETPFEIANGVLKPLVLGGYDGNSLKNLVRLNKFYESDKRRCKFVVKLYSDTVMNVHIIRKMVTNNVPNDTMYVIDCSNSKLKMCALNWRKIQPNVYTDEVNMNITSGNQYIVEVEKYEDRVSISVSDYLTGTEIARIDRTDWLGGTQLGYYCFTWGGGTAFEISEFDVSMINNPNIAFVGDSITEGYGVENTLEKRFATMICKDIGNCTISAGSSDGITDVISKFASEFSIIKPKILFVTISTNDTNPTQSQFNQIKTKCDENGIKLILNHIPCNVLSQTLTYRQKNELIDNVGVESCKFDVATALNNDIDSGVNANLFISDKVHPNELGHKAMYDRALLDLSLVR